MGWHICLGCFCMRKLFQLSCHIGEVWCKGFKDQNNFQLQKFHSSSVSKGDMVPNLHTAVINQKIMQSLKFISGTTEFEM